MSIPVLGIPHYNLPHLLRRCVESIDFPVDILVIVQNGPDSEMPNIWPIADIGALCKIKPGRVVHIRHPNAGVAGSWNEIVKLFPADYWFLVNNDIEFAPGDLERMITAVEADKGAGCFYANHGASFWVLTEIGVHRVGLFDENFHPAYCEDCDWSYRADMLKIRRVNVQGCKSVHGIPGQGGSCTVNLDRTLAAENMRTHGRNMEYYKIKWGGETGKETYKTPFNDPRWPLQLWHYNPVYRRGQQWNCS